MLAPILKFRTFQGYLSNPDYQDKLLSPPYDIISTQEAKTTVKNNEISFLHVNKPEIDLPAEINQYDEKVYCKGQTIFYIIYEIKQGLENLENFIKQNYLIKDSESRVYLYSAKYLNAFEGKSALGVILLVSMDDYEKNLIKRHEKTRIKKEIDRTKILEKQQANIEPLFLFYENSKKIDASLQKIIAEVNPIIDTIFMEENIIKGFQCKILFFQVQTKLWKVPSDTSQEIINLFQSEISTLYIADGHHRTAASYINYKTKRQQAEENGAYTGEEDFNYAMALCYPKSDLLILDYNRVIKTLCGKEKTEILKELEENFKVENLDGPSKPQIRGEIVMYLEHQWYLLTAKDQSFKFLDVDLIDKHCFQKIFGIKDIRTDERVEFIGGLRNQNELTNLSDNTHGSAFFMFPVKVEDIIATVNQNEIMPCKSTWVEPIPRSGAVVRLIADSNNNNNNFS